jgi:hypothetical protein
MSEPKIKKAKKKQESDYEVIMPDVMPFGKYRNKSFDDIFYSTALFFQDLEKKEWIHEELRKNIQKYNREMKMDEKVQEYKEKKRARDMIIAKAKENAEKLEEQNKKTKK